MRLYTKTGDGGDTGLIGGQRVSKDDPRVAAYGEVDELNACLGWCACACRDESWSSRIGEMQHLLFALGAQLADPGHDGGTPSVTGADVARLEGWIDEASGQVAPLKQFILPGGSELSSRFHLARAVCRRAERAMVALHGGASSAAGEAPSLPSREGEQTRASLAFINRLADLLFAWARLANADAGVSDVVWRPDGR